MDLPQRVETVPRDCYPNETERPLDQNMIVTRTASDATPVSRGITLESSRTEHILDAYVASTWSSEKGYQFEVALQANKCSRLCRWDNLTSFRDIGYLCVGDLVHIAHHDQKDRLGLVLQLKQDLRDESRERWTFVLFVWMISQKELEFQGLDYRLVDDKTYVLSNWCQVLPFNYVQALPECHIDADLSKIETRDLFDVTRKCPDGLFHVRELRRKPHCELSQAIQWKQPCCAIPTEYSKCGQGASTAKCSTSAVGRGRASRRGGRYIKIIASGISPQGASYTRLPKRLKRAKQN